MSAQDVADLGPQHDESDSEESTNRSLTGDRVKARPQLMVVDYEAPVTPPRAPQTTQFSPYRAQQNSNGEVETTPVRNSGVGRPSSADGSVSNPDDTPSLQGSLLSSPRRRPHNGSPAPSLRPFDRRFTARPTLSPSSTSRRSSVQFLGHRPRQPSFLSYLTPSEGASESADPPWEVVRWNRMRKISGEAFSDAGRKSFGRPTCIAVSSLVVLGTSKGVILVFDHNQNLQAIIGLGTKATESGAVTAIALSDDHTTVAAGHARGNIFTWEIAKPAKPFLHIPATNIIHVQGSKHDGHVEDVAVLHVGFLGTRHTALVSADDRGMAFSHLATRGMGALARTVHTTRILGRYPDPNQAKPKKPSSVLAFSSLPLGNTEAATDTIGLVAMLTPYLLVIVSTTPVAQTQHKAARPKELAAHGALSAALAWYPSMKFKNNHSPSNAKLAYSWLNVLTILEVIEVEPSDASDRDRPPEFQFKFRKRWTTDESIVAIQWLSRSVLALVTITQRLLILEENTLEVADSVDLMNKHMYHTDFFSEQLSQLIEKLDEENSSMHGVVADAFYMSFRAYKGRLFLLGFNDLALGTRSNWADRLIALMEHGDFVGAIQLATTFHKGHSNQATVGLPDDAAARQALVLDKLTEMMSASLRYAFGQNTEAGERRVSDLQLEDLAQACFAACLEIRDTDFLFEEVFPWYNEYKAGGIFLQLLEEHVLETKITTVPPAVLKELVNDFVGKDQNTRLEELLCLLNPATMDLDQVTTLCKQNKLYDALFYVWSQAIGDYTTILKELIDVASERADISTVFAYLSYVLTGRVYPTGEQMREEVADPAKLDIYFLLFSGSSDGPAESSSTFKYLRRLLELDTPSFMSMLNEAFEDSFLNGAIEVENRTHASKPSGKEPFKLSLNRQYVIQILQQLLSEPQFEPEDILYLDMFIARNLPKYQQFILLPGKILHRVLLELCNNRDNELVDDCQLSVEYLLSVYQPPDLLSLIPTLFEARFFRVIKSIYSAEKEYALLLQTCFADTENPLSIFECIRDCLRSSSQLTSKQRSDVRKVIADRASEFLAAGTVSAADTIDRFAPDLHVSMIASLKDDEHAQFDYLRELFEPSRERTSDREASRAFLEQYIQLLCEYDPHHVRAFIETLSIGDLKLDEVLPALERSSAIDAAVVLMAREGKIRAGLDRLVQHLHTIETALLGLLEASEHSPDMVNSQETADDLIASIEKYARIGVWLCEKQFKGQTAAVQTVTHRRPKRHNRMPSEYTQADLLPTELCWLDLVDAVVQVTRHLSEAIEPVDSSQSRTKTSITTDSKALYTSILPRLRLTVQSTFSALLANTASPDSSSPASRDSTTSRIPPKPAFLPILSAFLARAASTSPSLSHLRAVLASIFAAYAYEEGLLSLASRLLSKDLFARVDAVHDQRRRGWRPLGMACAGCGRRAWGPGAGKGVWEAWEARMRVADATHERLGENTDQASASRRDALYAGIDARNSGKGKARMDVEAGAVADVKMPPTPSTPGPDTSADALVVFACRHLFHRRCLEKAQAFAAPAHAISEEDGGAEPYAGTDTELRWRCPLEVDHDSVGETLSDGMDV